MALPPVRAWCASNGRWPFVRTQFPKCDEPLDNELENELAVRAEVAAGCTREGFAHQLGHAQGEAAVLEHGC
jgi:hypothetical protein